GAFGEVCLEGRRHPGMTLKNRMNRVDQGFDREPLMHDRASAETKRAHTVLRAFACGENDYRRETCQTGNLFHRPAVHLQAEQDDVGRGSLKDCWQLARALDFRAHLEVRMKEQERFEALAEEHVIIGDDEASRHGHALGITISRHAGPSLLTVRLPPSSLTRD